MTSAGRLRSRNALLAALSIATGLLAGLALLELGLRLLPVREALETQPVNQRQPYKHFKPQREAVFSSGWDFQLVNKVRVNNVGFVNAQDYSREARSPLLAVIGDSYVEALMVAHADTIHGRLAAAAGQRGRVYSFGASGAALSQYLAYARYARETFSPHALVVVVVGNDFDESLLEYKSAGGFHYLAAGSEGKLSLQLQPYEPTVLGLLVRRSALARYLAYNLSLANLRNRFRNSKRFVGNVPSDVDAHRSMKSIQVIDYFLEALPAQSGVSPSATVIVVDAMRPQLYDKASLGEAQNSYFARMRAHLLGRGRDLGYAMVDMQPRLMERHAKDGARFEWSFDGHWNSIGHEEAATAVLATGVPQRVLSAPLHPK